MAVRRPLMLCAVAAVVTASALLAGCAPTAAPKTPRSAAATSRQLCPTSALKITLDTRAAGAAAGSYYVPLMFENVSAGACALPGFPVVSFAASAAGPDIGQPAVPERATRPRAVILAPGAVAHAWLQIVAAANYSPARCKPVTAAGLRVGLTTAASTTFVARATLACARPPADSNILGVFPVQLGQARQGTAP